MSSDGAAKGDGATKSDEKYPPAHGVIPSFVEFLKACTTYSKLTFPHVVFAGGTVVRCERDDDIADLDKLDVPPHRFKTEDAREELVTKNKAEWEWVLELPEAEQRVLRKGYAALVENGYMYPGTPLSDRHGMPISLDGNLWLVAAPEGPRSGNLFTLVHLEPRVGSDPSAADKHAAAMILGGDNNRLDTMCPRVYAVIGADLAVKVYNRPFLKDLQD